MDRGFTSSSNPPALILAVLVAAVSVVLFVTDAIIRPTTIGDRLLVFVLGAALSFTLILLSLLISSLSRSRREEPAAAGPPSLDDRVPPFFGPHRTQPTPGPGADWQPRVPAEDGPPREGPPPESRHRPPARPEREPARR